MKPIDLLQTASSSMVRSKARTILTIIAIFIGAMTITLTNGIGSGIKTYLTKQIGNLGATNVLQIQLTNKSTNGPGSATSGPAKYNPNEKVSVSTARGPDTTQLLMSSKDIAAIEAIPGITSATPERILSPDYIMGKAGKYQLSIEQQFGGTSAQMLTGQGVNNKVSQNQITVPEDYVSSLGYSSSQQVIGQLVTIAITSAQGVQKSVTAQVVGVQQKTIIGDVAAYANMPLAHELYAVQSAGLPAATANFFTTVEATFSNNASVAQIASIKSDLSAHGYTGLTIKDLENTIFTAINVIIIVFDMFGGIALLAASFGIINTLYMSVQERTKEIGLMKALGMSPKRIFALFSIEAVLIGFWGSILGVGFAALIVADLSAKYHSCCRRGYYADCVSGWYIARAPC
jgi:putative ABC transport system permease protein